MHRYKAADEELRKTKSRELHGFLNYADFHRSKLDTSWLKQLQV